jgi:hypothetical protein
MISRGTSTSRLDGAGLPASELICVLTAIFLADDIAQSTHWLNCHGWYRHARAGEFGGPGEGHRLVQVLAPVVGVSVPGRTHHYPHAPAHAG